MFISIGRKGHKRNLFICVLILGSMGSLGPDIFVASFRSAFAETKPDLNLIEEARKTIQGNYVDRPAVDPRALTYGAISGVP
jgi:hypothetical protein